MNSTTHPVAARRLEPALERVQVEHELSRAYEAAKTLEERLELAALDDLARTVRGIRSQLNALFVDAKSERIRSERDLAATARVLVDVHAERERQERLGLNKAAQGVRWSSCADPAMDGGDDRRYAVLGEEVGEVANAILDGKGDAALREELVQVAAVAVAWTEAIDGRGEVAGDAE